MKSKLYIDFDNTTVNTTKRICEMYNEDFKNHDKFKSAKWYLVNKYNFSDQCPLLSKTALMTYFDEERFFNQLEFIENAYEIINKLSDYFDIYFISLGNTENLRLKKIWLQNNLQCIKEFVGCNFNDTEDKRHIDLSNDTLIDDCSNNLITSNAKLKILYGDLYSWNEDWKGIRKWNWYEVYDFLMN